MREGGVDLESSVARVAHGGTLKHPLRRRKHLYKDAAWVDMNTTEKEDRAAAHRASHVVPRAKVVTWVARRGPYIISLSFLNHHLRSHRVAELRRVGGASANNNEAAAGIRSGGGKTAREGRQCAI